MLMVLGSSVTHPLHWWLPADAAVWRPHSTTEWWLWCVNCCHYALLLPSRWLSWCLWTFESLGLAVNVFSMLNVFLRPSSPASAQKLGLSSMALCIVRSAFICLSLSLPFYPPSVQLSSLGHFTLCSDLCSILGAQEDSHCVLHSMGT